jgi:hypothetical protein
MGACMCGGQQAACLLAFGLFVARLSRDPSRTAQRSGASTYRRREDEMAGLPCHWSPWRDGVSIDRLQWKIEWLVRWMAYTRHGPTIGWLCCCVVRTVTEEGASRS